MEILLWLAPAALVTVLAMLWAAWAGRDTRHEVDPEVAVRRMARALEHDLPSRSLPMRPIDRSTGVAVRPRRAPQARPAEPPRDPIPPRAG